MCFVLQLFKIIYLSLHRVSCYYGITIKIVTYINKRKLFMANVVTKLDDEVRWGAILGVLQTDVDKFRMGLARVLEEVHSGMVKLEDELNSQGIIPETDGRYNRYFQLCNLLGGIHYALKGVDGILSSTIVEMLRDLDEK